METNKKVLCDDCYWHGLQNDLLIADHPFLFGRTVFGCPKCSEISDFPLACDEPGCWQEVTCGTPTPTGYRQTCYQHKPV
jgi:hypothetical protein